MPRAHPEQLFISAVLRTQDMKAALKTGVSEGHFTAYKIEWSWIAKHYEKHGSVPSRAAFKAKFPACTVYKTDDLDAHAEDVKQEFARTRLTEIMDDSIESMMKGNISTAMTDMQSELLMLQATVADVDGEYDLADDWDSTFQDVVERVERVKQFGRSGIPTGFPTLDTVTGGLQPGWLVIPAARLGQGKTWTMISMACHAAMSGYTSVYWSLEQSRHQIAMRSHTLMSAVHGKEVYRSLDLQKGTGFDLKGYKEFLNDLKSAIGGRFVVNDTKRGRVSPMAVAAGIERSEADIAFIDYLTLMEQKGDGGWLSVGQLTADLKNIAEAYKIPVCAASQINRTGVGTEPPDVDTLSRSDSVGQDADVVITMSKKSESVMKMKLAKNRHGPDGVMWFTEFRPGQGVFREVDGDRAGDLIEQDQEV